MTKDTLHVSGALQDYLLEKSSPPDELLSNLENETLALGEISRMQIAGEQGTFMTFLVRLLKPSFCLEIGTFTGYSAICIARGLRDNKRPGSKLLCCDVSTEWTDLAKKYWAEDDLLDIIDLEIAPALTTLGEISASQQIDFAFIDADKENYINYYNAILPKLAPDGIILVDNVLWGGAVIDSDVQDETTTAIRNFNDFVYTDPRTTQVMLPIADGLTLITHAS